MDAVDIWFARNKIDSKPKGKPMQISDEIAALPNIEGFGTTRSLHETMMLDTSGKLQNLVEQFIAEENETIRRALSNQIVFAWTEKNSALQVLEALTAEKLCFLNRFLIRVPPE